MDARRPPPNTVPRSERPLRFGAYELDPAGGRLLRDGCELSVRPKVWAALLLLVGSGGRVVPRAELFDVLWPETAVSDAALTSVLRDLRRLLGRDARGEPYFETLRGRGVRFLHPVHGVDAEDAAHPERATGDFVGRVEHLERARHAAEAARSGRGQMLLIPGAPGIGKTRTVLEIARSLEERGFAVHFGRCLEEEGAPAWWPFIEILRGCVDETPPEAVPDEVRKLLAVGQAAQAGASERTAADDSRFRIFDAALRAICSAAERRPRALVVDDLHRIDAASLGLLHHLATEIAGERILLIATYRDGEVDPGSSLATTLQQLEPGAEKLALKGLEVGEVDALVRKLSDRDVSSELAEAICVRTAGNPLYVREMTRELEREGVFERGDPAAHAVASSPEGVHGVIRGHLSRLSETVRELLAVASVIGRQVDLGVLRLVCDDLSEDDVRAAVDTALGAQLLVESPRWPGRLHFAHILVRDALYEALPATRRMRLHAAVGCAIEARWPLERSAQLESLAHHFFQAVGEGEAESALDYSRQAAERCLERSAYESAVPLFENALYSLELLSSERHYDVADTAEHRMAQRLRSELLTGLGRALWSAGETASARERFEAAVGAARKVGDAEALARAALGYTGRSDATQGVNLEAVCLLEEALERLPGEDGVLQAECMGRLATELYYAESATTPDLARSNTPRSAEVAGDVGARRDALTRDAVAMAERLGDDALLSYALSCRHYVLLQVDVEPEVRAAISERMVEIARRSDVGDAAALGGAQRVLDLIEVGDVVAAEAALREFEQIVAKLQQPFFRWRLLVLKTLCVTLEGRVEDAERLMHETLSLGETFGTENASLLFAAQLFMLSLERGRLADLDGIARAVLDEGPALPVIRTAVPLILLAAGRESAARDAFEQLCVRDFASIPRDNYWLFAMTNLARACVALGDSFRAERLYRQLRPFAGRIAVVAHGAGCLGSVSHFLGLLAAAMGELDAAEEHLEEAEAVHRRLGARLLLAHTRRELALVLDKSGTPQARERARTSAREALETFKDLGLPHHADSLGRLLSTDV
jgi:DNA-binding winged helix-turn-helix (wHTH) protein/tetratricopeptide (TPR) repeat protein